MTTLCSFAPDDVAERRTGEVLEPTERGFFLASNTLYPPGTILDLAVTVPGKRLPVRLRGEVAWARTRDRAGMYVAIEDATTRTAASPALRPQLRA